MLGENTSEIWSAKLRTKDFNVEPPVCWRSTDKMKRSPNHAANAVCFALHFTTKSLNFDSFCQVHFLQQPVLSARTIPSPTYSCLLGPIQSNHFLKVVRLLQNSGRIHTHSTTHRPNFVHLHEDGSVFGVRFLDKRNMCTFATVGRFPLSDHSHSQTPWHFRKQMCTALWPPHRTPVAYLAALRLEARGGAGGGVEQRAGAEARRTRTRVLILLQTCVRRNKNRFNVSEFKCHKL